MRGIASYHSSQTLEGPPNFGYIYPQFYTSGEFDRETFNASTKLLSLLQQLIKGVRTSQQLYREPSRSGKLRKQSSIEDLALLCNDQPIQTNSQPLQFLPSMFSSFQMDEERPSLGSRLSIYTELSTCVGEDFKCIPELKESDITSLFSKEDFKIMVLAVALLCKYLHYTGEKPTSSNISALFFTSAILGFKLAYDNELPGLMAEFSRHLHVPPSLLQRLEASFLKAIDYDLRVDGRPIKIVMGWLI